jgi:hypothetical protein
VRPSAPHVEASSGSGVEASSGSGVEASSGSGVEASSASGAGAPNARRRPGAIKKIIFVLSVVSTVVVTAVAFVANSSQAIPFVSPMVQRVHRSFAGYDSPDNQRKRIYERLRSLKPGLPFSKYVSVLGSEDVAVPIIRTSHRLSGLSASVANS